MCRVNIRVDNPTKHDITFKERTIFGHLQQVKSVTSLEVKLKEENSFSIHGEEPQNVDMLEICANKGSYTTCVKNSHVVTFLILGSLSKHDGDGSENVI